MLRDWPKQAGAPSGSCFRPAAVLGRLPALVGLSWSRGRYGVGVSLSIFHALGLVGGGVAVLLMAELCCPREVLMHC
jgi:hypothetical protein